MQKVREAERQRQFDEYKDRVGEIVNGLVKRVEFGNVVVDLGRAEAMLRRDELLPRENFSQRRPRARLHLRRARGDPRARRSSCRAPIRNSWPSCSPRKCRRSTTASSRSRRWRAIPAAAPRSRVISQRQLDRPGRRLRRHARQPRAGGGRRAAGREDRHHPVVARTRRPSSSTRWPRPRSPRSCWTRSSERIEVVVPDDQLSLAIGRRGQNVRLASQLTGWDIDILTEAEESERRQRGVPQRAAQLFIEALDVDDVIAHLLVTEGFASVEEVAYVAARGAGRDRRLRRGRRRPSCRTAPATASSSANANCTSSAVRQLGVDGRRWPRSRA